MKLDIGAHRFVDVNVPLLWGSRAVLQDGEGRLSVVNLEPPAARLEILGGQAAPGISYTPTQNGISILSDGQELYFFSPKERRLSSDVLGLPDCVIGDAEIRIGTSTFSNNSVSGFGVGIGVTQNGFFLGGPIPPGLAELVIDLE